MIKRNNKLNPANKSRQNNHRQAGGKLAPVYVPELESLSVDKLIWEVELKNGLPINAREAI